MQNNISEYYIDYKEIKDFIDDKDVVNITEQKWRFILKLLSQGKLINFTSLTKILLNLYHDNKITTFIYRGYWVQPSYHILQQ